MRAANRSSRGSTSVCTQNGEAMGRGGKGRGGKEEGYNGDSINTLRNALEVE